MMNPAEGHLLKPETSRDYAIGGGVFMIAALFIAVIGIWGVQALAGLPNWQTHASLYVIDIGLGVAFCCGASIYCINRARCQPDSTPMNFHRWLARMLRTFLIEFVSLLLALVQLAATAMAVVIVCMHIVGYPVPSPHAVRLLLQHGL